MGLFFLKMNGNDFTSEVNYANLPTNRCLFLHYKEVGLNGTMSGMLLGNQE